VRFLTSHVGEKSLLTAHEPLGVADFPIACQPER
jgi:hypothetical protein